MKAIICGGRNFDDWEYLETTLNHALKWWKLTTIITGGARGADSMAHTWAVNNKLQTLVLKADWNGMGRAAGMIRNKKMLEQGPDIVIAFPGGTGTENMITISRAAGVPVFIV